MDLIGEQRVETIMETVAELNCRNVAAFQRESTARRCDVEDVSCWHRESLDYHSDAAGFFVIQVNDTAGEIAVEHYNTTFELLRVLHGKKALEIYSTIVRNGWVTVLGHAAYLGRELAKAELALRRGWLYEQNQDVREPSVATPPVALRPFYRFKPRPSYSQCHLDSFAEEKIFYAGRKI